MHPCQRRLAPPIEEVWLAALDHAGIDSRDALLYLLDGRQSPDGYNARAFIRCLELQSDSDGPELEPLLDEMNRAECIDAYRLVVFTERSLEGVAAAVRHELEHSLQFDAYGQPLVGLHEIAEAVISERVGGLPGGALLYQFIPDEMDANAAASTFVRSSFGTERIDELLRNVDSDAAAFRSLIGPASLETLPERMVSFLASLSDLCAKWAERQGFAFPALLDAHWGGAGGIWRRLVEGEESRLPRGQH